MFNVERAITPKLGKPELLFMCSAHPLMVLYIYVKFCENIMLVSELRSGKMAMFNVQRVITLNIG